MDKRFMRDYRPTMSVRLQNVLVNYDLWDSPVDAIKREIDTFLPTFANYGKKCDTELRTLLGVGPREDKRDER